jgi:hypothetical protein
MGGCSRPPWCLAYPHRGVEVPRPARGRLRDQALWQTAAGPESARGVIRSARGPSAPIPSCAVFPCGLSLCKRAHLYAAPRHVVLPDRAGRRLGAILAALAGALCKILQTNFREFHF